MRCRLSFLLVFFLSQTANAEQDTINLLDPQLSQFENVYPYGTAEWVDGELILQSTGNWFFTTKNTYADFILTADILMPDVSEYSNSGIMFRGQYKQTETGVEAMGYQAEVDPSDRKWSGGLFDQARRKWLNPVHKKRSHLDDDFVKNYLPVWTDEMAQAYKHLQWNSYRIECRGNDIKIYVNDVLTTHVIDNKDAQGFIGLQHHGSKALKNKGISSNVVKFRNVTLTPLN